MLIQLPNRLQDTSGDDSYSNLRRKVMTLQTASDLPTQWYKWGDGFIFVCNVTSKVSLQEARMFFKDLMSTISPNDVPRILVATSGTCRRKHLIFNQWILPNELLALES
jgi:hypothetical protein